MPKPRDPNLVYPEKDRYYVYALCKPDGTPFYIGKGVNSRINDHFKPSNLQVNSPKVGVIKKYGNKIKREVLSYFDSEDSAYDFEEYLIDYYGISSEGGLLTNYAKTRFQYSERFVEDVCKKGHENREYTYSKDSVLKFYEMYFLKNSSYEEIQEVTGLPINYQYALKIGRKWSNLFEEYVKSPTFLNVRVEVDKGVIKNQKISDQELINAFNKALQGLKTLKELAEDLQCNEVWLGKVFLGNKRKYLNLDVEAYTSADKGKSINSKRVRSEIYKLLQEGKTPSQILKLLNIGRTTLYRHIKEIKKEADSGSPVTEN